MISGDLERTLEFQFRYTFFVYIDVYRKYIPSHPHFCAFHLELRPLTAFQKPASPNFLPFTLTLHPESA